MRYRLTAKDSQERTLIWCGSKAGWCLESQLTMRSARPKLYGTERMANMALRYVTKDEIHQVEVDIYSSRL